MRNWKVALIQLEKAALWAKENDKEIYEKLLWSINKINSQYEPTPISRPEKASPALVVIKKSKAKSAAMNKQIDFTRPISRLKGTHVCNFCQKRHLGCRRCTTKGDAPIIICGSCFYKRNLTNKNNPNFDKSFDALDYAISGSYGNGKRR